MARFAIVTQEIPYQVPLSQTCSHHHTYQMQISLRVPVPETSESSDNCTDADALTQIMRENPLKPLPGVVMTTERAVHAIWDLLVAAGVPDQLLYRIRFWEAQHRYVEITHAERETDAGRRFEATTHSEKE